MNVFVSCCRNEIKRERLMTCTGDYVGKLCLPTIIGSSLIAVILS